MDRVWNLTEGLVILQYVLHRLVTQGNSQDALIRHLTHISSPIIFSRRNDIKNITWMFLSTFLFPTNWTFVYTSDYPCLCGAKMTLPDMNVFSIDLSFPTHWINSSLRNPACKWSVDCAIGYEYWNYTPFLFADIFQNL